jgi:hypothetical protein
MPAPLAISWSFVPNNNPPLPVAEIVIPPAFSMLAEVKGAGEVGGFNSEPAVRLLFSISICPVVLESTSDIEPAGAENVELLIEICPKADLIEIPFVPTTALPLI